MQKGQLSPNDEDGQQSITPESMDALKSFLRHTTPASKLQSIDFSLIVSSLNEDAATEIAPMLRQLPHLKEVKGLDINSNPSSVSFLSTAVLDILIEALPHLEVIDTNNPDVVEILAKHTTSLKVLDLSKLFYYRTNTGDTAVTVAEKNPLETLVLSYRFTDSNLCKIAGCITTLQALDASYVRLSFDITSGIVELAKNNPNLKKLALNESITSEGVRLLALHTGKIDTLNMSCCYSLKGEDVVAIAKHNPVETLILSMYTTDADLKVIGRELRGLKNVVIESWCKGSTPGVTTVGAEALKANNRDLMTFRIEYGSQESRENPTVFIKGGEVVSDGKLPEASRQQVGTPK